MSKPPNRAAIRRAFGKTVRSLRLRVGLPQEDLAFASGINRGYMGGLERGLHSPTLETVFKLLGPLQVTVTEFCQEFERHLQRNQHRAP
jgi:transcriptional regulator with XRE-family HTH domain